MSKHLKSKVIEGLKSCGFEFEPLPAGSTPHARGVKYFRAVTGVDMLWGAMDEEKEGRKYKKRIIVRQARYRDGLFELYTYHFPKVWSAGCVANRELIKEAQRRAHALEKDYSFVGIEWRIRFFQHYFKVYKGGEKPEEGMKAYSHFYQYVYVAIYRQLKAEAKPHPAPLPMRGGKDGESVCLQEEISFEPIEFRPSLPSFASPFRSAYNYFRERNLQPPKIQLVANPESIPRTTAEFAYIEKKQ